MTQRSLLLEIKHLGDMIAEQEAEKEKLDIKLTRYEMAKRSAERLVATFELLGPPNKFGPIKGAVAKVIFESLIKEGTLDRKQIFSCITQAGIQINSVKPVDYVSTILTMDARFEQVPDKAHHWRL